MMGEPGRVVFFNIDQIGLMYGLLGVSLAIFVLGVRRKVNILRRGQGQFSACFAPDNLKRAFRDIISHRKIRKQKRGTGIAHMGMFYGFSLLFVGTLVVMLDHDFGLPLMRGYFYLIFQSLILDLAGLALIFGVLAMGYQRYVRRIDRLSPSRPRDAVLPALVLIVAVSGFMLEGLRLEITADPWAAWSPVGLLFGRMFGAVVEPASLVELHRQVWWFHLVVVLSSISVVPYTKLWHMVAVPANILLRSGPRTGLRTAELETYFAAPADPAATFTKHDLFDVDACVQCGRCQEVCPAHNSGKPLNPKVLIRDLHDSVYASTAQGVKSLHGGDYDSSLWSCTTCAACVEVCPAMVDHVGKVVELKRFAVMASSRFPDAYRDVFRNLEIYGDPMGKGALLRDEWIEGAKVVKLSEHEPASVDVLFWAGCMGALFDEDSRKVLRSAVSVLDKAGLTVGVLGSAELCCGDPARRMGNEFLYRKLAARNIDMLQRLGITRIVTNCPHCFNTLGREYAELGFEAEVFHMVDMANTLIRDGRLKVSRKNEQVMTFHDSCYLGRHSGIYDQPRELYKAVSDRPIIEMERSRESSQCCGAGGGNVWCGASVGQRMETIRLEQAVSTGAESVASSCPYCRVMLDSASKQRSGEKPFAVKDLIEIVDMSCE